MAAFKGLEAELVLSDVQTVPGGIVLAESSYY